jgi:hypothetical protein
MAVRLNDTCRQNLPVDCRNPKDNFEAQRFAALALRNIKKRAELNHREDWLGFHELIKTVNDLLQILPTVTTGNIRRDPNTFDITSGCGEFREENLRWHLWHGLVLPRYVLRDYNMVGTKRGLDARYLPTPHMDFNRKGELVKVTISRPLGKDCHRLDWYRQNGYLIEPINRQIFFNGLPRPDTRKLPWQDEQLFMDYTVRGVWLFTFAQAWHVQGVHRMTFATLDWLSFSPAKYREWREFTLPKVASLLQAEGLTPPRFCQEVFAIGV